MPEVNPGAGAAEKRPARSAESRFLRLYLRENLRSVKGKSAVDLGGSEKFFGVFREEGAVSAGAGSDAERREGGFDVASAAVSFRNAGEVSAFFRRAARALKPSGRLYLVAAGEAGEMSGLSGKRPDFEREGAPMAPEAVVEAAEKESFFLEKCVPMPPTPAMVRRDQKYGKYAGVPLARLMVFRRAAVID